MSITSDILRGHTEAIILAHLLEQDSYGYQINKDIMKKTDNRYELKEATLYSAFRRLEQAGCYRGRGGFAVAAGDSQDWAWADVKKHLHLRGNDTPSGLRRF